MASSSGPALDFSVLFKDDDGFRAFWQQHAFRHQVYANRLATVYSVQPVVFDLMDVAALDEILHQIRTGNRDKILATTSWLLMHSQVHAIELNTVGGGTTDGLTTVDLAKESDFYDWMGIHESLHDFEDQFFT